MPSYSSDINAKQSSIANPTSSSGLAAHGIKSGSAKQVFFSVGLVGDYKTVDKITNILSMFIANGIATFSFPQVNQNIGVGDKVIWNTGSCYLQRKLNFSTWKVTDQYGSPYSNISTVTVTSIVKTFNSLASAIDGDFPGLHTVLNTYNLQAEDVQPNIVCYNFNDSGSVNIKDLWTIDASRYIKIYTPINVSEDCNIKHRHKGVSGVGYSLNSSSSDAIVIDQDRISIIGLQIISAANAITVNSSYNIIRNNLICNCSGKGIYDNNTTIYDSQNYYICNTIYNCTTSGIEYGKAENILVPKVGYIYNNTIAQCGVGIKALSSASGNTYSSYLKNNLCYNNTTGYLFN